MKVQICLSLTLFTSVIQAITGQLCQAQYNALHQCLQTSSCTDVRKHQPNAPSGTYRIVVDGQKRSVYCFFGDLPGCGTGAWQRVVTFNRKSSTCPANLLDFQGKGCTSVGSCCNGVKYAPAQKYNSICGRVRGYRFGTVDGFGRFPNNANKLIDQPYVDGVSVTKGSPRQHVWSYVTSFIGHNSHFSSPCISELGKTQVPSFVGNRYTAEVGTSDGYANLLWDGAQCLSSEIAKGCCKNTYFSSNHATSMDPIELRICTDQHSGDERVVVPEYDIYVQLK